MTREGILEILPIEKSGTFDLSITSTDDPIIAAAEWFKLDVANGDARADTISTYLSHVKQWFSWCTDNGVHPGHASANDVKRYRSFLVECEAAHSTISLKLTTIRRFYQAATDRQLIPQNPAAGIKAPRNRKASEKIRHLTAGEAELLFRSVVGNGLRAMRDRAMLVLMLIEGLRRVEIVRMSLSDLEHLADQDECKILIHGKGKDAYIYPREDTVEILSEYLAARGNVPPDASGDPVFVSIDKGSTPRRRLSRIGLNGIVDAYFGIIGVKAEGVSCHALRHTCGFLVYRETKDLRVVQEVLRHSSPVTSAKYADIDAKKHRHTRSIKIKVSR